MTHSGPFHYTLLGRPVNLYILRDAGCRWGRLVFAGGENFDVGGTERELYDWDDASAVDEIVDHIRAHGSNVLKWTSSWMQDYEEPQAWAAST